MVSMAATVMVGMQSSRTASADAEPTTVSISASVTVLPPLRVIMSTPVEPWI